ncbi:MAG: hypothetical protein Q7T84_01710 [Phenylobacterium sp.]|nr:hypothetical protein [Phenylobacterium sp.]MDO9429994.1 hypothetical protein [Phenylobacterium sp.]
MFEVVSERRGSRRQELGLRRFNHGIAPGPRAGDQKVSRPKLTSIGVLGDKTCRENVQVARLPQASSLPAQFATKPRDIRREKAAFQKADAISGAPQGSA